MYNNTILVKIFIKWNKACASEMMDLKFMLNLASIIPRQKLFYVILDWAEFLSEEWRLLRDEDDLKNLFS